MKNIKLFSFLICLFFTAGCVASGGGTPQKTSSDSFGEGVPSWVSSPPNMPGYVYGIGVASIYATPAEAMVRAKENARLELLKQLKVSVSGETSASVRRDIVQGSSKITRTVFNYAKSSVKEAEIPGIKIIKTSVSRKDKQVFALAELNKSMAEMDLSETLENLDKQIKRISVPRSQSSKIRKIKILLPGLKLIEKRKKIAEDLNLVSDMDNVELEKKEHTSLKHEVADLLDSMVIVIRPVSYSDKTLASGIRKSLSDQGVRVRMDGVGDLYLRFSSSLNTVYKNGVYFTFASGQASIMNKGNDIVSEFSTKVKSGSGDRVLSNKRAVEKLALKLGNEIAKGLFDAV